MDIAAYLEKAGIGQQELADRLGVTQPRISQWIGGATVPAERVKDFERVTKGLVTRHDLRPDIFGLKPKVSA